MLHLVRKRDPAPHPWTSAHARDGRLRFGEQRQLIRDSGATLELIDICQQVSHIDPDEVLDKTRRRVHSCTWPFPNDVFQDSLAQYAPWSLAHARRRKARGGESRSASRSDPGAPAR